MKKNNKSWKLAVSLFTASTLLYSQFATALDKLDYIGEYSLPTSTSYQDILFVGISGLYFDADKSIYYGISDARNTKQEGVSRFYTLTMDIDKKGIHNVNITGMKNLLNQDGKIWPNGQADAEGIAPTPNGKGLFWTSELGSALRITDFDGSFIADYNDVIPPYYNVLGVSDKTSNVGVRSGTSFEGVSLTPDKKNVFISVETALKQDGPISTPLNSSPARLLKYDANPKTNQLTLVGEYIYNIDPIPEVSEFAVNDNGVSDILAINDHQLLFIERAGRNASKGYDDWNFNIRVYLADITNSTNIKGIDTLSNIKEKSQFQPIMKKLLIDFSDYTDTPDNVEGITFGPIIDGHKTLVFVTDNNFQPYQSNKFYVFIDNKDILK